MQSFCIERLLNDPAGQLQLGAMREKFQVVLPTQELQEVLLLQERHWGRQD